MLIEAHRGPDEGTFEHRGPLVVADEKIRNAKRHPVHRPSDRDPLLLMSDAPVVLHGRQLAGVQDVADHAGAASMDSSGASARKRTTSPIARRAAGVPRPSKRRSAVRPISSHPPGETIG